MSNNFMDGLGGVIVGMMVIAFIVGGAVIIGLWELIQYVWSHLSVSWQ